jgi:hypothetical protein
VDIGRGWLGCCRHRQRRTQNGHIRNDTRDALRRILSVSKLAIYRRKCVASDRACTRVPPLNFHGKEGVDGSSPPEGFAKAPQIGAFSLARGCTVSNLRWVWSPLWSLQVAEAGTISAFRVVSRAALPACGANAAAFASYDQRRYAMYAVRYGILGPAREGYL